MPVESPMTPRPGNGPSENQAAAADSLLDVDVDLSEHLENLVLDEAEDEDEPVLRWKDGRLVDTWREGYPYAEPMPRSEYEALEATTADRAAETGELDQGHRPARSVVLFEGRDAAGKGGTIKRFTEHLNPRGATVVALEKPTERELGEWYFQRYVRRLPDLRRDRSLRPLVVQPGGRGAGDGVLLPDEQYEVFVRSSPGLRGTAHRRRDAPDQAVVLGVALRAAYALLDSPHRPGEAVEAVSYRPRLPRPLGRLHGCQGGDVQADRHAFCSLDGRQEQRQEARPHWCHALRTRTVRLPP